ncbi:MAG TPA: cytochrome c [Desulfuromonadales bacterium]|nr:cytochrome c [Desulfuromonadales bacterium]
MKRFMSSTILLAGIALLALSGCGSVPDDATAGISVGTATKVANGAPVPQLSLHGSALYATNCARCHGPLTSSSKKERTARLIQSAITGNVGGMGYIMLTGPEIQAIADSLGGPASSSPGTQPGKVLYDVTCSECHRLGTYDSAGLAANLSGKTGIIAVKISTGHKGISLNAQQITDLTNFMDDY